MPLKPAILLDRDGTLIADVGYLSRAEQVTLLPGAAEAVRTFNQAGWPVILVTNQSGVARGLFSETQLHIVHAHLQTLLQEQNARLDAWYYCPHGPADGCPCRKPKPGMLLQAAREHAINLAQSWMIGDQPTDVQAGLAAGCQAVLFSSWPEVMQLWQEIPFPHNGANALSCQ